MIKKTWLFLVSLLIFAPLASAQNDSQFWHAYNWKFYSKDKLSFNLYMENRITDDASRAFGYFIGPTVRYKINKTWSLGAAAKMIYLKLGDSGFNEWQRTELEATYKLDFGRLKFAHRNRHEYFFRDVGSEFNRYRSRLAFTLPRKGVLNKWTFSNEFFYDDRSNTWAVNRFVPVQLSFKLNKRLNLNTYYMWEHRRSGSRENHILGTTLLF